MAKVHRNGGLTAKNSINLQIGTLKKQNQVLKLKFLNKNSDSLKIKSKNADDYLENENHLIFNWM
jgi:hypothetical protein